jgi:hypothetical protein
MNGSFFAGLLSRLPQFREKDLAPRIDPAI